MPQAGRDVYLLEIPVGDTMVPMYIGADSMYAIHHLAAQWGEPMPAWEP